MESRKVIALVYLVTVAASIFYLSMYLLPALIATTSSLLYLVVFIATLIAFIYSIYKAISVLIKK